MQGIDMMNTPDKRGDSIPHIAVVIPMYCAEATIVDVIRGIPDWIRTIVVVDDKSTDDSLALVRDLANDRLIVVEHPKNLGVGAAVWDGYEEALRRGAEILVKMDSDGQMAPSRLPELIAPILQGAADYTKGNRFMHAVELQSMPWLRRVGNLGLSFLAKLASGYWNIFDPTNGYTAIHAKALRMLDKKMIHDRYFFEISVLLELGIHRAVVRDVFIPARYQGEPSHLSILKVLGEFPLRLLAGVFRRIRINYYLRDFNMVSLFLLSGILFTSFGMAFGAYHWHKASVSHVGAPTGTIMLSVLPIILGIQFLLQAISADIQNCPTIPLQIEGTKQL
jgi:glycosyltransferase involved in cell wall biosynthesis